ncbi:DNA cytosine methylase [Mesomycoplasma neurolyticum]|uniref:DNA (cytosine-5-)-methyltransferase n=2 Tax=Mesomycoplasma neurolyticum TaxID=2120 RepID=A0A449A5W7_9BACT|nr:DNA cytosine methylase [Mesomycoplasma neurolyticum]
MKKNSNSRSGLVWEIERILNIFQEENKLPGFLLLENVPAMLNKHHKQDYESWLKTLKELNYSTLTLVLNSFDYGSIQKRKRVYGISILNYNGKTNEKGEILDLKIPKSIKKEKQKIQDVLKLDYTNSVYLKEAIEAQPKRTKSREKIYIKNPKLNLKTKSIRTLTTRQDRNPNCGIVSLKNTILDNQKRKLNNKANFRFITPREAYLCMGFNEEDFNKVSIKNITKAKLYQQAGNSIVIYALKVVIKLIQKQFNKKK